MAAINMNSIMNKVRAHSLSVSGKLQMKEYINKCRSDGRRETNAGGRVITEDDMRTAAGRLIKVLQDSARASDLPPSVMQHFYNLDYSEPKRMPDGSTIIYVYFGGDLHRESLEDGTDGYTGEGIDNIIALLNNGAHASNYVYGWWNGHSPSGEALTRSMSTDGYAWVRSKKDREGLHFIQQAVDDFNGNYGADYNVTAIAGEDYQS